VGPRQRPSSRPLIDLGGSAPFSNCAVELRRIPPGVPPCRQAPVIGSSSGAFQKFAPLEVLPPSLLVRSFCVSCPPGRLCSKIAWVRLILSRWSSRFRQDVAQSIFPSSLCDSYWCAIASTQLSVPVRYRWPKEFTSVGASSDTFPTAQVLILRDQPLDQGKVTT